MFVYSMVGILVIGMVIAMGIFWILSNVTFRKVPQRYTYTLDEEGNAVVVDVNGKILPKDTTDA